MSLLTEELIELVTTDENWIMFSLKTCTSTFIPYIVILEKNRTIFYQTENKIFKHLLIKKYFDKTGKYICISDVKKAIDNIVSLTLFSSVKGNRNQIIVNIIKSILDDEKVEFIIDNETQYKRSTSIDSIRKYCRFYPNTFETYTNKFLTNVGNVLKDSIYCCYCINNDILPIGNTIGMIDGIKCHCGEEYLKIFLDKCINSTITIEDINKAYKNHTV